ncbi:histidine phosphatase family protein [Arthrobacter woluwensis]|uniref:histidine phosphatase family protein n=1 Tax=Arthrobacter woluwensis TaxID=156980 RepID=UPI001AAF09C0|nr:histidine phosphatase family protein [Arthrobacter woluwensis]QTF73170.1 histidine phosphatase family protein [Arthrobacter woluwensis]
MHQMTRRTVLTTAIGAGAAAATGLAGATSAQAAPAFHRGRPTVEVYLARHGQTVLNALDRVQGFSDSPLTTTGQAVAKKVGANLAKEVGRIDAAYSADMVRHFQTVSLMLDGARSRQQPTRLEGLREVNFGGFEGAENHVMWGAILEKIGHASPAEAIAAGYTLTDLVDLIPQVNSVASLPAENSATVAQRMLKALNGIVMEPARHGGGTVLVVSSGLSITCALAALGAAVPGTGLSNGAVNHLSYSAGTWTVKTVNDTHYAN